MILLSRSDGHRDIKLHIYIFAVRHYNNIRPIGFWVHLHYRLLQPEGRFKAPHETKPVPAPAATCALPPPGRGGGYLVLRLTGVLIPEPWTQPRKCRGFFDFSYP